MPVASVDVRFGGQSGHLMLRSGFPLMTQNGHERAAFAAMHGPDLLYSDDPWLWGQRDEGASSLLGGAAAGAGGPVLH